MRVDTELTKAESKRLAELEAQIAAAEGDKAACLLEIDEKHLWRQDFNSFEAYCQDRWDIGQNYAKRIVRFGKIRDTLSVVPIGHDLTGLMPENERQVRSLFGLPDKDVAEVWAAAVKSVGGKQPPARVVEKLAKERRTALESAAEDEDVEEDEDEGVDWGEEEDDDSEDEDDSDLEDGLSQDYLQDEADELKRAEKRMAAARKVAASWKKAEDDAAVARQIAKDQGLDEATKAADYFLKVVRTARKDLEAKLKARASA